MGNNKKKRFRKTTVFCSIEGEQEGLFLEHLKLDNQVFLNIHSIIQGL